MITKKLLPACSGGFEARAVARLKGDGGGEGEGGTEKLLNIIEG